MYRGFRERHRRGYHTAYNGDRGRKQTYGASWTNERRDRGQEAEKDRRRARHARGREQNALLRLLPVLERLERGARAHHQRVLHAVPRGARADGRRTHLARRGGHLERPAGQHHPELRARAGRVAAGREQPAELVVCGATSSSASGSGEVPAGRTRVVHEVVVELDLRAEREDLLERLLRVRGRDDGVHVGDAVRAHRGRGGVLRRRVRVLRVPSASNAARAGDAGGH
jgi:hypothetical protein